MSFSFGTFLQEAAKDLTSVAAEGSAISTAATAAGIETSKTNVAVQQAAAVGSALQNASSAGVLGEAFALLAQLDPKLAPIATAFGSLL